MVAALGWRCLMASCNRGKDGTIIPEATYGVDDAVRQITVFATSCLK